MIGSMELENHTCSDTAMSWDSRYGVCMHVCEPVPVWVCLVYMNLPNSLFRSTDGQVLMSSLSKEIRTAS